MTNTFSWGKKGLRTFLILVNSATGPISVNGKGVSKIYGLPGQGLSTGGVDFFSVEKRGRRVFFSKIKGATSFFQRNKGGKKFFLRK